jgi:hypothetical protein
MGNFIGEFSIVIQRVGTKLPEIFDLRYEYLFLKTIFTSERSERVKIVIYNIPRDRYIAGNFFEQSSHTSVCSKKITRGRQPVGNFERQTRVLDCKKKFLAIHICPEVYSEGNRPQMSHDLY